MRILVTACFVLVALAGQAQAELSYGLRAQGWVNDLSQCNATIGQGLQLEAPMADRWTLVLGASQFSQSSDINSETRDTQIIHVQPEVRVYPMGERGKRMGLFLGPNLSVSSVNTTAMSFGGEARTIEQNELIFGAGVTTGFKAHLGGRFYTGMQATLNYVMNEHGSSGAQGFGGVSLGYRFGR